MVLQFYGGRMGIKTPWIVSQDPDGVPHVVPMYDDGRHFYKECPCDPEQEADGVIVHVSYDGREDFETGRRLPS